MDDVLNYGYRMNDTLQAVSPIVLPNIHNYELKPSIIWNTNHVNFMHLCETLFDERQNNHCFHLWYNQFFVQFHILAILSFWTGKIIKILRKNPTHLFHSVRHLLNSNSMIHCI